MAAESNRPATRRDQRVADAGRVVSDQPVTDEMLYAAGVTRDMPEGEPTPLPTREAPGPNLDVAGVEYRAMLGFTSPPPAQVSGREGEAAQWQGGKPDDDDEFGWLRQRARRARPSGSTPSTEAAKP